tara:strand:- start:24 stop:272 length:249 start_codon:yes stop_codon:yes gene_type:complete
MDKPKVPEQSRAVLSTTAGQELTRQMLSGKPLTDEAKKSLAQLRPNQGPAKEVSPLLRAWLSPEELESEPKFSIRGWRNEPH